MFQISVANAKPLTEFLRVFLSHVYKCLISNAIACQLANMS